MDFDLKVARCTACDSVFSYAAQAVALSPRPPTPDDTNVRERQDGGALVLEYRWFGVQTVILGVFAVFWNLFLFGWYVAAFASPDPDPVAFLFPLLHVAGGVAITYIAVATLLNATTVRVDKRDGISVRHGPVPWRGNLDLPVARISQLYLQSRIVKGKRTERTVWDLVALDPDGTSTRVLPSIDDQRRARFLEHRAEQFLGIVDRAVPGEDPS